MTKTIDEKFLRRLLETPSPSGCEANIQGLLREELARLADDVIEDSLGNLIFVKNPDAKLKILLAGHCDQIGLIVTSITESGHIHFTPIGGVDINVLEGSRVCIQTKDKGRVFGVVGRKPIHLLDSDERKKKSDDIGKLWIDIGAKDKEEAESIVEVGSNCVFELAPIQLMGDLITCAGLDDKVGLFVVMEVFRRCADKDIQVALYSASTVQEEVGLRGAKTVAALVEPDIGIAVDVTHAHDYPATFRNNTTKIRLGGGPVIATGPNVNPVVERILRETAVKEKIECQIEAKGRPLGNDANAIQIAGKSVATAAVGIPNRYMHTQVEVCSLEDIRKAVDLLEAVVCGLNDKISLYPR